MTRLQRQRRKERIVNWLIVIGCVAAILIGCAAFIELASAVQTSTAADEAIRASREVRALTEIVLVEAVRIGEEAPVGAEAGEAAEAAPDIYREDVPLERELQEALFAACEEFGVPYALSLAVMEQETRFRMLDGDGGESIGYFQVQPRWWQWLMDEIGVTDLTDPVQNIRTGCAVLGYLLDLNDGVIEDALGDYNHRPAYPGEVLERMTKWN